MKEIILSGPPFEAGRKYGSECAAEICTSIDTYTKRYMKTKQLTWEGARRLACRFDHVIGEKYREEMRGIACGAGLCYEDILALNLRSEILYTGLKADDTKGECTAFSAVAPATKHGIVLAGQTWDFTLAQRDAAVLLRRMPDAETPGIIMLAEAGLIGGKGVNDAGLCVTINALNTPETDIGIPVHLRMRMALEQKTLAAAYKAAAAAPVPSAACLMLTHRDGLSLGLELNPSGSDVLMPEDGILYHTNHFTGPRLRLSRKSSAFGSTYIRYQRMGQLMKGKPMLTGADFEGFVRDHAGYPSSICCHPDSGIPKEELPMSGATNHAFIADLTRGIIRLVEGNPCEGTFKTLKF